MSLMSAMNIAPRVLLLVENNSYPGDFRVRREAESLRSAGCQVSVIAPRGTAQRWHDEIGGVHVYRYPAPHGGSGLLSYAFEFAYSTLAMLCVAIWLSFTRGFDVIHAANPPDTLWFVGLCFKPFGKKFVFDHHDLAPEVYLSRFLKPRRNLVYHCLLWLERCSFAVADVVISTNESYRELAIQRGKKRPEQVFVVRNGPPLSYQPMTPDPALLALAPHLIGYVGTIGPQDGLDHWMRALRVLVFDLGRRDVMAVVVGDGDAYDDVRALAKRLGLDPFVHFTGRLSEGEACRCLSATTVCVQPDPLSPLNDRSTMNKLMEYMALGKPTVAFDLRETRVSAQGAALYVSPNDEQAFARSVAWLLDHPGDCERMGRIGQHRVASALAWEHSRPVLLRAYSEGLGLALPSAPSQDMPHEAHSSASAQRRARHP
ncbi:MAG: glycosyl transferase [Rhizobacter sp.]|nr:glycosyl transferase [Rhizobacter sp.]